MNSLKMECSKCRVSKTCPKAGSSPVVMSDGRRIFCQLIGGYGRIPVEKSILSPESAQKAESDGPCLTIAEVPVVDEATGLFHSELVKVFHPAVLHERENISFSQRLLYPKAFKE